MKFVLDTNVVSALRVAGRNPAADAWAASVPMRDLYVAAVTVAEIERGVVGRERSDPGQGRVLRPWCEGHVLPAFAGRVLPFDLDAARVLATYRVPEHAPADDAMIASIAQATAMTVATRNTKHFAHVGVPCIDHWRAAD